MVITLACHDDSIIDITGKLTALMLTGMQLPPIRYVVFEYCDNLDLFNYLVTGPLEREQQ